MVSILIAKSLTHSTAYPNATGHNNGEAEQMPLFETSSLFILLLAYQNYSGDTTYAQEYRSLLEGYADYLVRNSLYPSSQLISVDAIPATANQTGLAIQSAIGLKAASVILDNTTLADTANSFAEMIYNKGLGLDGADPAHSSHFTYNYGKSSTWNVLFPAFSDVLLDLETFPSEAWELQSQWYESQIKELGLPFAGPSTNLDYIGSPLLWGLVDWSEYRLVGAASHCPFTDSHRHRRGRHIFSRGPGCYHQHHTRILDRWASQRTLRNQVQRGRT